MKESYEKQNYIIALYCIEYIALFVLLISSIALLNLGYYYIFETENFELTSLAAHSYGFLLANFILILLPRAKAYLNQKDDEN